MIPSRKQIAAILGVSPETVTKVLKSSGITNRTLDSNDLAALRKYFHPLFYKMSRERLAKVYQRHPETLARDLKEIGILHHAKLSFVDLQNIYWKLDLPKWIFPLGIQNDAPTRANVEMFYKQIGVKMTNQWYEFYFETLGTAKLSLNPTGGNPMELHYVYNSPR